MKIVFNAAQFAGDTITIDATQTGAVTVVNGYRTVFMSCPDSALHRPHFGSMTHRVKLSDLCAHLSIEVTHNDILVVEMPFTTPFELAHPSYRDVLNQGAAEFASVFGQQYTNDTLDVIRAALEQGK